MKNFLLCLLLFFFSHYCFSQQSDFILLKKNQHTVKTFFAGSPISFETDRGFFSGKIRAIEKDSIYLIEYDIRQVPSRLGVFITDTISAYNFSFNYKEILQIEKEKRRGFDWSASGASLFGGGILLTTIGLATWVFTKPGTQYYASPYLVAGSAALAGIGYLLMRSRSGTAVIGKKYHLEYIRTK